MGCSRSAEEICRGHSRGRSRKHVLGHGWGGYARDRTGLEHGEKSRQKRTAVIVILAADVVSARASAGQRVAIAIEGKGVETGGKRLAWRE